jgi:tetratricopeptide (TPR) repeat protein
MAVTQMSRARAVALAALASLFATSAGAQLPRVVVVLEESADGKRATTTSAEVTLTASLHKDGYRLVSGEMADRLRRAQAVSMALAGGIPDVLSSLDADIAVLGQVEMSKIGTIEGAGLVGYRAAVVAKLVRVDTAQIVDAFTLDAKGNDFSDAGAAQKAARAAGDELARVVKASIASLAKKPKSVDLLVHGVPDRAQMEGLKAAIQKTRGVTTVVVRQSGKGVSKIELTSSSDAEALASELERGGVPLDIVQTSASSILARYDLRRGVKLGAVVQPPTVKLATRAAWVKGVLADLVAAELQNVTFIDVMPARSAGADVTLTVEAASAGAGRDVALTLTAKDAHGGARLFVASGTGKLEDLPGLVSSVVKKLDEGFLPAVARSGAPRGGDSALARAASAGKKAPPPPPLPVAELRIDSLRIENLFPAKLGHYQDNPVGSLVLQHTDPKGAPAVNVTVSVYVPRFMQLKSEVVVGTLEPGERREVPIKLTLDNATLFAIEENTPTQAEVVVDYDVAGGKMNARRVSPLLVYGRRAIDWTESAPIAAFVTPQEEAVRAFARAALVDNVGDGKSQSARLPDALAQAIAVFQAMSSAELRYVKDPAVPARSGALDTVQFARETLTLKSGDCDDLSVLYASLLESIGVETAFLLVPGHVLLGVSPGVPADALERVTLDPTRVVVHDGKAYVPVETTALGKSFREAWAQGASVVQRVQGSTGSSAAKGGKSAKGARGGRGSSGDDSLGEGLIVVETRQGWASYPPAALPRAAGLQIPRPDPKKSGAAEELRLVAAERDHARKERLTQLATSVKRDPGAADANAYAALLARMGEISEARAVLKAALEKKPGSVTLTNNLANVEVLDGDAAAAVARYRSILGQAGPRRGDVLTNIGIAYMQAGDSQKAIEAFDAALAAGSASAFVATGFERKAGDAGVIVETSRTRASDEGKLTVAEQELKSVLKKALEQRKRKAAQEKGKPATAAADRFQNPLPSGARRGDDPQSKLRTAELLRWMSS